MLMALAALPPAAAQVTIEVNATAQVVSVAQPSGVVNANCTLGEAILAANTRANVDACLGASTPADPITLSLVAGTYDFANVGANVAVGPVSTPMALPAVQNSIALVGNGAVLRRSPDPDTPAMGFFRFDGTGLNLSARSKPTASWCSSTDSKPSPDFAANRGQSEATARREPRLSELLPARRSVLRAAAGTAPRSRTPTPAFGKPAPAQFSKPSANSTSSTSTAAIAAPAGALPEAP